MVPLSVESFFAKNDSIQRGINFGEKWFHSVWNHFLQKMIPLKWTTQRGIVVYMQCFRVGCFLRSRKTGQINTFFHHPVNKGALRLTATTGRPQVVAFIVKNNLQANSPQAGARRWRTNYDYVTSRQGCREGVEKTSPDAVRIAALYGHIRKNMCEDHLEKRGLGSTQGVWGRRAFTPFANGLVGSSARRTTFQNDDR